MAPAFAALDHVHMARALRLAERGLNTTQPNPRVGCVIAHGEAVVGEGWHERAGQPHAEVHALREAGERAKGATAYVTLEPCAHHGRTPPCADALVAAGVARVVIAAEDPNPQVDGRGIERLRAAGIAVETGLMREPARELNIGFFHRLERGRPFVRVKLAMSLDGRTALADGTSKWITGEAARADVQRWRARSSAILTGSGTALADDPRLTVRLDDLPHVPPLRVLLDRALRTPEGAHLLDGSAPTLVVHGAAATPDLRFAAVESAVAGRGRRRARPGRGAGAAGRARGQRAARRGRPHPVRRVVRRRPGRRTAALRRAGPPRRPRPAAAGLPPLADMSQRWGLDVFDRRSVGDDLRLRLRPHA